MTANAPYYPICWTRVKLAVQRAFLIPTLNTLMFPDSNFLISVSSAEKAFTVLMLVKLSRASEVIIDLCVAIIL